MLSICKMKVLNTIMSKVSCLKFSVLLHFQKKGLYIDSYQRHLINVLNEPISLDTNFER